MTAGHVGDDAAMRAVVPAGLRSGKSMREIAVDLCGADRVAAGWHGDGRMRAKVRRHGEASGTETGDGVLAWTVLRQVVEYREARDRHAAAGAFRGRRILAGLAANDDGGPVENPGRG